MSRWFKWALLLSCALSVGGAARAGAAYSDSTPTLTCGQQSDGYGYCTGTFLPSSTLGAGSWATSRGTFYFGSWIGSDHYGCSVPSTSTTADSGWIRTGFVLAMTLTVGDFYLAWDPTGTCYYLYVAAH